MQRAPMLQEQPAAPRPLQLPQIREAQPGPKGEDGTSAPEVKTAEEQHDFDSRVFVRRHATYFDSSVLSYGSEGLLRCGVYAAAASRASVLANRGLICDVLVNALMALAVGAALLLSGVEITDDHVQHLKELIIAFHSLCTFLLGFFITTCLSRWWAIRADGIGGLWGNLDDIVMLVGSYFPQDNAADREVRERVLRWGVLSHELMYKQASGEEDLGDLVQRGLLLDEERKLLEPLVSRPQVIWAWMCSYFAHLAYGDAAHGGGRLPFAPMTLPQLHAHCCKARDAIGLLFTYTDTQVPFRYVHFLCLIVWLHNLMQALTSAVVLMAAINHGDGTQAATESIFLCIYPMVYLGLLHLGASMLNPVRSASDVDFPRGAFTHFMLAENRSFFAGSTAPCGPPYAPGRPPVWKRGQCCACSVLQ